MKKENCAFCKIMSGDEKNQIIKYYNKANYGLFCNVAVIEPFNPVVENGHFLVIPDYHIENTLDNNYDLGLVYQSTMKCAALFAHEKGFENNIITSTGANATQTVFHLHIHIVERKKQDNLKLPWN